MTSSAGTALAIHRPRGLGCLEAKRYCTVTRRASSSNKRLSVTGRNPQPRRSDHQNLISVNQQSAISPDEIHTELERVLADSIFANAEKMTRFLRFVVLETLEGRGDHLNETLVGMEVYSREGTFDPRLDSTVRVEAGRLRAKLREFYESQGDTGRLRIEIPKGSYKPIFKRLKESGTKKPAQSFFKKPPQAR